MSAAASRARRRSSLSAPPDSRSQFFKPVHFHLQLTDLAVKLVFRAAFIDRFAAALVVEQRVGVLQNFFHWPTSSGCTPNSCAISVTVLTLRTASSPTLALNSAVCT